MPRRPRAGQGRACRRGAPVLGVGLKMLFGDPVKLLGLVAGIAFSTLLMTQQGGFFVGLISRSAAVIGEAGGVDVWVMDPLTETVESPSPLRETDVLRVRGVPGVAAAEPFLLGTGSLLTAKGETTAVAMIGVDDGSFLGLTPRFVAGSPDDLRRPDAVALDQLAFANLWPGEPIEPGRLVEINGRRAVIAALTDVTPGFGAPATAYGRRSEVAALLGTPQPTSFVLVRAAAGEDPAALASRIEARTGLRALTAQGFTDATVGFILTSTGIAFSFGVVIALGAVVGILVAGLTFSLFVNENLRQFAVLKAVGLSNGRLALMVLAQALTVAAIGYSIGLWLASAFFDAVDQPLSDLKGFFLPWQVAALVAGATVVIIALAALSSLWRVLRLDPATVFRG